MKSSICSGYICHYFLSEDVRNNCIDLVDKFLGAGCAKNSTKCIEKLSVLNGTFNALLPSNMLIHIFIAPFYFEDTDANLERVALYSRLSLTFCELYNFGIYFDQPEFRSDYAGCYDEQTNENFRRLTKYWAFS